VQLLECQTAFLPLPLPATKCALFLDPLHCIRMLAHSIQTHLHPRTTHLPLTTDLFQAWKTSFTPTPDCFPASSTACYQVCTLPGPTALPQNAGALYPDTFPPTDNSLATNHRPFQAWKTSFTPTLDCLTGSSTACYQVCTLPGPTALPQNAGALYPDTSQPTDNSLATNHRPFPGMENRFSTNYGVPFCLFHCLLPRLHFCVANKYCRENPLGL